MKKECRIIHKREDISKIQDKRRFDYYRCLLDTRRSMRILYFYIHLWVTPSLRVKNDHDFSHVCNRRCYIVLYM